MSRRQWAGSLVKWLLTVYCLLLLLWGASEVRLLIYPDPKCPLSEVVRRFLRLHVLAAIVLSLVALLYGITAVSEKCILRLRSCPGPGHCPKCGYDLRATPDRCPECGTAVPDAASRTELQSSQSPGGKRSPGITVMLPLFLFLGCGAVMGLLGSRWPVGRVYPAPYNRVGVLLVPAGMALVAASLWKLKRVDGDPFGEPVRLVQDGTFRFSRNPMCLGLLTILLGMWIVLEVFSPIGGVLLFVLAANQWHISAEERSLHQKFGSEYQVYCSKTRRWI